MTSERYSECQHEIDCAPESYAEVGGASRRQRKGRFAIVRVLVVVFLAAVTFAFTLAEVRRIDSNESSAIRSIKAISDAQGQWFSRHGEMAKDLSVLTAINPETKQPYLKGRWFEGVVRSGYVFSMTVPDNYSMTVTALPEQVDKTGMRTFS